MRTEPKRQEPGLSIVGSEAQGRKQASVSAGRTVMLPLLTSPCREWSGPWRRLS